MCLCMCVCVCVGGCHPNQRNVVFFFLICMLNKFPSVSYQHSPFPCRKQHSFCLPVRFTFFKCILNEKESHRAHSRAGMAHASAFSPLQPVLNGQSQLLQLLTYPSFPSHWATSLFIPKAPLNQSFCVIDLQSGWRLQEASQENEKLFKIENKNATVLQNAVAILAPKQFFTTLVEP